MNQQLSLVSELRQIRRLLATNRILLWSLLGQGAETRSAIDELGKLSPEDQASLKDILAKTGKTTRKLEALDAATPPAS